MKIRVSGDNVKTWLNGEIMTDELIGKEKDV